MYNKFWVALLGTLGQGLTDFNVLNADETSAIVGAGIALLTAFGVYAVPNKS